MNYYIDPTSDIFIVYLLGSPENKTILLDFVNAVLLDAGFDKIVDVEIQNPFNIKTFIFDKVTILDVKATDEKGRIYDIEVQTYGNEIFINRSVYYWARNYSSQIVEGESYINLKPVICINLLKFKLFQDIEKLHTCFMIFEKDEKIIPLTDQFQIHFLELPKFKDNIKLNNSLYDWLLFFKNEGHKEEDKMETLLDKNKIIKNAHEKYKIFTQNDELKELYEARMKFKRDQATLIEEAKIEAKIETAKKMKNKGFDRYLISEITGLSIKEIDNL